VAKAPARVWYRQAWSDCFTANLIAGHCDRKHQAICQVLAKCQQTIEKSVKAIIALCDEKRIVSMKIGGGHSVSQFFSGLIREPARPKNRDIHALIVQTLSQHRREEIKAMEPLAPKWPAPGQPFPSNTEYPFQDRNDPSLWRAPADKGVFAWKDIERFLKLANAICRESDLIISAMERRP
jgi:hypothetical protein